MTTHNHPYWNFVPSMKHIRKFNFRLIAHLAGMLMVVMASAMLLPIIASIYYGDGEQFDLILSSALMMAIGLFFRNILGRGASYELHEKESFWIVAISWITVPLTGSIPYLLTGTLKSFTDAAFESFSGFTTTGASVLCQLNTVPRGLLVWRSLTQWIGGLGLIMFVIALLRKLNVGSAQLYDAEFSGTVQRKLHPRISTSVTFMWLVYLGMTLTLFLLLILSGNEFLIAFNTALSVVSTGGFQISDAGIEGLSATSMWFVTIFMFFSGVNIALLFRFITGHGRDLFRSEEFRLYLLVFLISFLLSSLSFILRGNPVKESLGFSAFHLASTISTCGLTITPPQHWPLLVSAITFILIIVGAMSGSTGGGLKLKRIMLLIRYVRNYFIRMIHPNVVFTVRIDKHIISDEYINKIFAFVFMYIFFIVGGAFILTLCGLTIPQAVCMAAANISNLGPTPLLGEVGAHLSYVTLPIAAKWTLMVLMLVGRVEIFAIMAIVSPAYWRR